MKKGFVLGLATGLTVAGASLVLANSQIQAILNEQIKVTLNGQIQEFKDETTNETQYPITYKDRTYLPLRTVANLVGVDVDYDASSNTAILNNRNFNNTEDIFIKSKREQENVLSVLLEIPNPPTEDFNVINIDIFTNKVLSAQDVIKKSGKNVEQVEDRVKEKAYNLTKEFYDEQDEKAITTANDVQDISTLKDETYFNNNYDFSTIGYYFNELGNLSFYFKTYFGVVGQGAAYYFYDLETDKVIERVFGY